MNMSGTDDVSVYAEAKGEYTRQLCQYLIPALQQYFLDLLEEAKLKEADSRKVLVSFQTLLEGIADWNMDKVQRETGAIADSTHCDYLQELLTAVFLAHTKVLSAIRLTTKRKKLQIIVPKLDHFLHRTLTECARLLWSNTYLFSPNAPALERQKNLRQIESFLTDGVLQAIRSMLPVKNILREYLKEDSSDDEDDAPVVTTAAAAAAVPVEEEEKKETVDLSGSSPSRSASSSISDAPTVPVPSTPPSSPAGELATAVLSVDTEVAGGAGAAAAAAAAPIFTGMDTQFQAAIEGVDEGEDDAEGSDDEGDGFEDIGEETNDIQILDEPPAPLDDFEDLERPAGAAPAAARSAIDDEFLPMEFESLD